MVFTCTLYKPSGLWGKPYCQNYEEAKAINLEWHEMALWNTRWPWAPAASLQTGNSDFTLIHSVSPVMATI